MKINPIDASDRFDHFTKQNFNISECCEDLIEKRPFGDRPFYIFAHARTDDDGVTKRLIWQPRLTKPKAQTNSMLFKARPGSDVITIVWMIPDRALWRQFQKGNLTENKTVVESIHDFLYNREKLEAKDKDDPTDAEVDAIYREISVDAQQKRQYGGTIS